MNAGMLAMRMEKKICIKGIDLTAGSAPSDNYTIKGPIKLEAFLLSLGGFGRFSRFSRDRAKWS